MVCAAEYHGSGRCANYPACPRSSYQQRQGHKALFLARLRWEAIEALRARAHRLWRRVRIAFWTGVACIHFVRALRRERASTINKENQYVWD